MEVPAAIDKNMVSDFAISLREGSASPIIWGLTAIMHTAGS